MQITYDLVKRGSIPFEYGVVTFGIARPCGGGEMAVWVSSNVEVASGKEVAVIPYSAFLEMVQKTAEMLAEKQDG